MSRLYDNALAVASLLEQLHEHEMNDDEALVSDMIEAQTDLMEIVSWILRHNDDDIALIDGITARQKEMITRKGRLRDRVDARREVIRKALETAGIDKLELPECTVALTRRAPQLVISDIDALPPGYLILQPPKPDRAALTQALRTGATIEGAHLDNGSQSISVRKK